MKSLFVLITLMAGFIDGYTVDRPVSPSCPDVCPLNFAPVCGSDGKTYGNDCELSSAACRDSSIFKVSDGQCGGGSVSPPCSTVCPINIRYAPVCGSNGQTYSSDCELSNAACRDSSIYKVSDGECGGGSTSPCSDACPFNYAPVCGSDGKTYSNECLLSLAVCRGSSVNKVSDGECGGGSPQCSQVCPLNYAPVCGSDGKTYSNDCELSAAACRGSGVFKTSNGECGSGSGSFTPSCSEKCPLHISPVCGSDGKTYANECELRFSACRDASISKVQDGECGYGGYLPPRPCSDVCPANYAPVCGSDGKTYSNECELKAATCRGSSVYKISDGECGNGNSGGNNCNRSCTRELNPVCGSNGQTYNNPCLLQVAACDDPSISKSYDGPCCSDC